MKRNLAIAMAAVLVSGSVTNVFAASFSDINNVPWEGAKTYINSVADLGLMVGDTNTAGQKVFRAKDQVTYCETMQLAYTLLKNSNNLKDTSNLAKKWNSVLSGYSIPTWAFEAVSYGLEYGILSLSDVGKFMKSATVSNNATREGVAVIFGKTLAAMNSVNAGATLYFNDKTSIAQTSIPYVDLLVRLDILVGDDNNNFNAKNYINRAEMAVMVSKTNTILGKSTGSNNGSNGGSNGGTVIPPTTNPGVNQTTSVKGTITKTDSTTGMITILADSKSMGFFGNDTVVVVKENSTDQLKYSDLNIGDIVTIEYQGSLPTKITVNYQNPASAVATVKGYIDEITNDKIYINKDSGGTANYSLQSNVKITIDGSDSTLKQLFDATDDGLVSVELSVDSSGKVSKIIATESDDGAVTGLIKSIDSDEIEIKKTNGKTEIYDLSAGVVIKLENKDSSVRKVDSAMDDDDIYAKLYLDSRDRVTKLFASEDKYDVSNYDGLLKSISSSRITVKKSSGSTKEYTMSDDVTYRLDGSSSKLNEIKDALDDDDLSVKLTFDSKDKVTKVEAFIEDDDDDDEDDTVKGEITKLSSSVIKIEKSNGKSETIDLLDDTTFRFEDSKSTLRKLRDEVDEDTVYAIVTLDSKGRATEVEAFSDEDDLDEDDDTIKGEIISISRDDIDVRKTGGSRKTYDYANSVTFRLDGYKSNYSDIRDEVDDDTVTVKLTLNSKDYVTKVEAETEGSSSSNTKTVKGTLRNLYSDRVSIRNENDKVIEYDLASRIVYYLDGTECKALAIENAQEKYSGMKIQITLNSKDQVTEMKVYTNGTSDTNRTIKGDLIFITDNSVKINGDSGQEQISFSSSVDFVLDGSTSTVKAFNAKFDAGYKIAGTVYVVNDKVTKIDGKSY